MSHKYCHACKKLFIAGEGTIFHSYPTNLDMRRKWLEAFGDTTFTKSWKICSAHFKPTDYKLSVVSELPRLLPTAVPSLNLTKKLSALQQKNISKNENIEKLPIVQQKNISENENIEKLLSIKQENTSENENIEKLLPIKQENTSENENIEKLLPIKQENTSENIDAVSPEAVFIKIEVAEDPLVADIDNITHDHEYGNNESLNLESEVPSNSNSDNNQKNYKISSKKLPNDTWKEFGDEEFLNYKRVTDVNWDKIANDPKKTKLCWEIALETIEEKDEIIKTLKAKVQRLENKIERLKIQNLFSNIKFVPKTQRDRAKKVEENKEVIVSSPINGTFIKKEKLEEEEKKGKRKKGGKKEGEDGTKKKQMKT